MNTCSTCKHWTTDDYRLKGYINRGICLRLTMYDADPIHTTPEPAAEANCFSEGIGGDFYTSPNFGCTEHDLNDG